MAQLNMDTTGEERERKMKNGTATHLVLDTASLHLVCENLCAGLLGFSFMDVFHEHALVLEHITLGFLVKRVIPAPPNKNNPSAHPNSTLKNKKKTHKCLSIFPASLYFLNNLLNTLCLLIQSTLVGILASLVPFLFPGPVCLPFLFAANSALVLARECTVVGLTNTCPSLISFLTCVRELALPISACSAGSSQILRLPTPATDAASRFWERRLTIVVGGLAG
jgi:hypothetical protein